MSTGLKEAARSAESVALATARPVGASSNTGMAAPSIGQSTCSKRPVAERMDESPESRRAAKPGSVTPKQSQAVKGHPNQNRAAGKPHAKGGKHNKQAGQPKTSKQNRKDLQTQVDVALDGYRATAWFLEACKNGFKNDIARLKFNKIALGYRDQIDPAQLPVCQECGESNVELCEHYVVAGPNVAAVEEENDAMLIPAARGFNIRWRFAWVDRVRRMFTWPRFDSKALVNHDNMGFDPAQIPDDEVWPEMLCYIRMHLNTSYKIDGKFDRQAKLAHCNKLAIRYLTDRKIKISDCLKPQIVNAVKLTVARACDQRDDQTLLKECDPRQNFGAAPVLLRSLVSHMTLRNCIIAGAIISPVLMRRLVIVSLRAKMFVWFRLVRVNADILAHGSVLVLKYAMRTSKETIAALLRATWSGLAEPCWTGIRQLLWQTASTTSMRVCISGI